MTNQTFSQKFTQKFFITLIFLLTFASAAKASAALNLGSATLSASGNTLTISTDTNKDIILSPNGTGTITGNYNTTIPVPPLPGFNLVGASSGGLIGYSIDSFVNIPFFIGRRANGTALAPTAVAVNDVILRVSARGYTGSAYTGGRAQMDFLATENWTPTANGTGISFLVTPNGTTGGVGPLAISNTGRVTLGATSSSSAWGVTGINLEVQPVTKTDTSSSGTVATVVSNSFAIPTFATSNVTTYTNAANVYIAGDVAAGTNATLTNSYGLWNVGKSRLDGAVSLTSALNKGTCVLGTSCAAITVSAGAICTATDTTAIAATRAVVSGTTLTITGTGTDTIAYTCL